MTTKLMARLLALFLTAAMLLSAPGCIANLHEKTDGFKKEPVMVGLGMPIAAVFDVALLPISIPANLVYFLQQEKSAPRRKHHQPDYASYPEYVEPYAVCGCCPQ